MVRPTDLQLTDGVVIAFGNHTAGAGGDALGTVADRWRAAGIAACRFRAIDDSLEVLVHRVPDVEAAAAIVDDSTEDAPRGVHLTAYVAKAANVAGDDDLFTEDRYVFAVRVYPVRTWVEPLRRWLHEEHFHHQLKTPGIRWSRGYEPYGGEFHFLNLWGVDEPDTPYSAPYVAVRDTPGYERVQPAFETGTAYRQILRPMGSLS